MSYQQILDDAIGQSPTSTVDVEAVVRRERRSVRTRWLGAATLVVGAVLAGAVLAGVVSWPFGPAGGDRPPAASPLFAGAEPTEDPAAAKVRLGGAMRSAVLAVVSDAELGGNFVVIHNAWGPSGSSDGKPVYAFTARTSITRGGRTGTVHITVSRRATPDECHSTVDGLGSCVEEVGPGGERMVFESLVTNDATHDRAEVVRVDRGDGCNVWVAITYDGVAPLDLDELEAIALDPRLTIYP